MRLDPDTIASVHGLLTGVPLAPGRAQELLRILDNREEFLAHLLVSERILDALPGLSEAVTAAAAASYVASVGRPDVPAETLPLAAAAFPDVARAQRALIDADLSQHDTLRALAAADMRYRAQDVPFPFISEPPFVPPVAGEARRSRLRVISEGLRQRVLSVVTRAR